MHIAPCNTLKTHGLKELVEHAGIMDPNETDFMVRPLLLHAFFPYIPPRQVLLLDFHRLQFEGNMPVTSVQISTVASSDRSGSRELQSGSPALKVVASQEEQQEPQTRLSPRTGCSAQF